jgi:putative holliday junction resolvase
MVQRLPSSGRILAMDIGGARIGLATAHVVAQIPTPIETVANDESLIPVLKGIVDREDVVLLVVGVPRNLNGEETAHSAQIRKQAEVIAESLNQDIEYIDESLSTSRADKYLSDNKKSSFPQDSIAACFILEEFLRGEK